MDRKARNKWFDWAARCEGHERARRTQDGVAVRMEWDEASNLSAPATASVLHMALTLHGEHGLSLNGKPKCT